MRTMPKIPVTLRWGVLLSCAVFALLSSIAFKNPNLLSDAFYSYDEADYMYAAEKGFFANYFDRGSLPINVFFAYGMKYGFDKIKWGQLSKFIRTSDNIAFYRHFHGPLYFYWLQTIKSLGFRSEKQMRYATMFLLLFSLILFCVILFALYPNQPLIMFMPCIMLFLLGPSTILTFNHITPHGLYLLFSCASLGCCALYCRYGLARYWYWSMVTASLAFLTIEYSAILILTLLITVWLFRRTHYATMPAKERLIFVLHSLVCFLLPVILLWPGGLLKLTIVENYLYYAYFTLIRGDLYSSFSTLQVWSMRVMESPLEYLALFCGIAALPFLIKKNRWLSPLALYALFILFTTLRNHSTFPQYVTSVFPVLYLIAATGLFVFLDDKSALVKTVAPLLISAGILANCCAFFTFFAPRSLQSTPYEITSLKDITPLLTENNAPIVINRDYIPTIHYYFPSAKLNPFNPVIEDQSMIVGKAFTLLGNRGDQVLLLFDRSAEGLPATIASRCRVENRRELFLSDRTPNAVCYRLSCK
jgi:hypothetical protein